MVLCPPDVLEEYLPSIVESAEVDAIVSDRIINDPGTAGVSSFIHCDGKIVPKGYVLPGPVRQAQAGATRRNGSPDVRNYWSAEAGSPYIGQLGRSDRLSPEMAL